MDLPLPGDEVAQQGNVDRASEIAHEIADTDLTGVGDCCAQGFGNAESERRELKPGRSRTPGLNRSW